MTRPDGAMLYVHVPFCRSKCAYCDFASFPGREADFARYFAAVGEEMRAASEEYGRLRLSSVFVGGGTPTLVPADLIARLLSEANRLFAIEPGAEITVEGNPGTVTRDSLRALASAGVNRVSFGAQAFQPRLLRMLGRIHTPEETRRAVETARAAGIENISLDLMYALPGQTMADWEESLRAAVGLGCGHVSCYSLIIEPGTPMADRVARGEVRPMGDEETIAMQRLAADALGAAGLKRYEISNYARQGLESRHNMGYWRRRDYLGLGCAAHSCMRGARFHNPETLEGYFRGERGLDRTELTPEEEIEEAVMLETRTVAGIGLEEFRARYGVDFTARFARGARVLEENGLARREGGRFFLTDRGMDVQSAAVVELLTE